MRNRLKNSVDTLFFTLLFVSERKQIAFMAEEKSLANFSSPLRDKSLRNEDNMKISTRGRYALRLMLQLALCEPNKPISIKDIAAKQNISGKYLEQIISVLNKAGFVKSERGPQGGYSLKMKPEKYTVGMILRLTEGSLSPVACLDDENGVCEREPQCATLEVWKKLNDAINEVVDGITLADLVEIQKKKNGDVEYYI